MESPGKSIHHDTTSAFPPIVPVYSYYRNRVRVEEIVLRESRWANYATGGARSEDRKISSHD